MPGPDDPSLATRRASETLAGALGAQRPGMAWMAARQRHSYCFGRLSVLDMARAGHDVLGVFVVPWPVPTCGTSLPPRSSESWSSSTLAGRRWTRRRMSGDSRRKWTAPVADWHFCAMEQHARVHNARRMSHMGKSTMRCRGAVSASSPISERVF